MITLLIREVFKNYKRDFQRNENLLLVCFMITNILYLMVQQYIK